MSDAQKSILANKQLFIQTNEKFLIIDVCDYLLSITEKAHHELNNLSIELFFVKDSLSHNDGLNTQLQSIEYPFHANASIKLINGKVLNVLWVVTPVIDNILNEIISFRWTGCEFDKLKNNRFDFDQQTSDRNSSTRNILLKDLKKKKILERITNVLSCISDGFVALDQSYEVIMWNPVAEKITSVDKASILGKHLWKQFPNLVRTPVYAALKRAMHDNTTVNFEQYNKLTDNWFEASVYPYEGGIFIYFKDITLRKKQENLLIIERNALEINVRPDGNLKNTVDFLLKEIENINPAVFCSVLLLEENNKRIRHLSAPRLPEEYAAAINGKPIGPDLGSFGTAINAREMVIISDLTTDTEGTSFRDFASKHKLKTCCSFPILDTQDKVLGCFACFYKESKTLAEEDINLIKRTVNLLKLIIENKTAEEKVRILNDRYKLATCAAKLVIWDWDVRNDFFYWGEGFYKFYGYKTNDKIDTYDFWETHIHTNDRESVKNSIRNFVNQKSHGLWNCNYRFKHAAGNYVFVINRGYLIFDKYGEALRMIGSLEDVTEKKRIERQLIKKEINRYRLIAQSVIEAEDIKKAKIGQDLHDNVNQMLATAKLSLEVARTNLDKRAKLVKQSLEQIYNAIKEITKLSWALIPQSVIDLGLSDSIKGLLENPAVYTTVKTEFKHVGDIENGIKKNQKLLLFRILHEQVNNVLKHSEAKHLFVQLVVNHVEIVLTVMDDGKGFDAKHVNYKNGAGLKFISRRTKLFNGKIKIISAPGKGCKLIVKLIKIFNTKMKNHGQDFNYDRR